MSEWIDVKDFIPEIHKDVLVYRSRGEIEIRYRTSEEYLDCLDPYNRYVWNDQGVCNDIIRWMPLPKPPEEK